MPSPRFQLSLVLMLLIAATSACSSVYYGTMEKLGIDKRDILVDRVEEARSQQEDARDQFRSTLDAFRDLNDFDGGELEDRYDRLKSGYEDSVDEAESVSDRINSIEKVAHDLFFEWEAETAEISDPGLRSESAQLRRDTQSRYDGMLTAMRRAESKMPPVLTKFHDQVLFLKHNLNARAISSLQSQMISVRSDVDALIVEMEKSIAEADAFLAEL
ncbi:MAG: DUF2959 domain-containing protein [Planctomycetota bacterium]